MSRRKSLVTSDAVRNFVFGVEDSLVSTLGLISGIAAAGVPVSTIVLTGIILILVEAFSMAAGSLLSDNSADEFEKHSAVKLTHSSRGALVMFFSYVGSGMLVILPYIFLQPVHAFGVSAVISLAALFVLGILSAHISRVHMLVKAMTMVVIGGAAIVLGMAAGSIVSSFL